MAVVWQGASAAAHAVHRIEQCSGSTPLSSRVSTDGLDPHDKEFENRSRDDGLFPTPSEAADVHWVFTIRDRQKIAPGFRAQEMEQKWNIRFDGTRLWFARSWTRTVVYVADTQDLPDGGLCVVRVHALRDPQRFRSQGMADDVQTVRFLIDCLLLDHASASPPTGSGDPIALWSKFGTAAFPQDGDDRF